MANETGVDFNSVIPSINLTGVDQTLLIVSIIVALGIFAIMAIIIFVMWLNRNTNIQLKIDVFGHNKGGLIKHFPYRCKIWVQRAGGKVEVLDRFGQFKVNGAYMLLFKKSKIVRGPLKNEHISQDGDTWFFSDSAIAAYPAHWVAGPDGTYDITPIKDYDAITFMIEQGKNDVRAFSQKDRLLEFAPYITVLIIFILAAAAFLIGVNMMTGSMNEQSRNTADAAAQLKGAMEIMGAFCKVNATSMTPPPV